MVGILLSQTRQSIHLLAQPPRYLIHGHAFFPKQSIINGSSYRRRSKGCRRKWRILKQKPKIGSKLHTGGRPKSRSAKRRQHAGLKRPSRGGWSNPQSRRLPPRADADVDHRGSRQEQSRRHQATVNQTLAPAVPGEDHHILVAVQHLVPAALVEAPHEAVDDRAAVVYTLSKHLHDYTWSLSPERSHNSIATVPQDWHSSVAAWHRKLQSPMLSDLASLSSR